MCCNCIIYFVINNAAVAHAKAITVAIAGALAACQPIIPVDK